jgi:hypothetical protein
MLHCVIIGGNGVICPVPELRGQRGTRCLRVRLFASKQSAFDHARYHRQVCGAATAIRPAREIPGLMRPQVCRQDWESVDEE